MNRTRTAHLPEAYTPNTRGERAIAAVCGLACAGLIFGGLTATRTHEPAAGDDGAVYVARQVTLPVEAPPPPPQPQDRPPVELAAMASPIQLEVAASASPVHIQVPDVPLPVDAQAMPEARPSVVARFDVARSATRPLPDSGELEGRRVFERHEVDQPPIPIDRVKPKVTASLIESAEVPRTVMLLIVNLDGTVGEVRLLQTSRSEDLDRVMMEAVRQWRFSPAVRKGRKVRCWVQQAITVQLRGGSPFSL